jgi:hypothetical protein
MILKLQGHFSYIDEYSKLKFTYLDEDTQPKLARHCGDGMLPFTDELFTVNMPPTIRGIPEDIVGKIGLDCNIYVTITKYKFISKLKWNKGQEVTGSKLILAEIQAMDKYN